MELRSLVAGLSMLLFSVVEGNPCVPRKLAADRLACVCNATYCDDVLVKTPSKGQLLVYTSSMAGLRFHEEVRNIGEKVNYCKDDSIEIKVFATKRYQSIQGFGGALSDAAAINMMSLSEKARSKLIATYFGKNGIEYTVIRIPMASCDFSTRRYTYLDTPNDFNLTTFALANEDIKYKIPLLKQIISASDHPVYLFGSPWTAPAWMKTNNDEIGMGSLLGNPGDKYHKTWAEYFTRFLDEYKKRGIKFWGVTMQNEPSNGLLVTAKWQSMGWTAAAQRDFIKTDLGPMLKSKGYGDIKLMVHDDVRIFLPSWPKTILSDKDASEYVSGIAVHWYFDWLLGPEVLNDTHTLFPDKFILATEACNKGPPEKELGSWEMGEKYSNDILENLNNWAVGWVDWNMCLDTQGGPNWVSSFDDSPIIVNATADEFYKQPMFYHLGHFSKFMPQGSVRVKSEVSAETTLEFTTVARKDGSMVLVVLNPESNDVPVSIGDGVVRFQSTVPARSIQSYLWK